MHKPNGHPRQASTPKKKRNTSEHPEPGREDLANHKRSRPEQAPNGGYSYATQSNVMQQEDHTVSTHWRHSPAHSNTLPPPKPSHPYCQHPLPSYIHAQQRANTFPRFSPPGNSSAGEVRPQELPYHNHRLPDLRYYHGQVSDGYYPSPYHPGYPTHSSYETSPPNSGHQPGHYQRPELFQEPSEMAPTRYGPHFTTHQDRPRQETPRRETPRRETPRQETPRQETPLQETTKKAKKKTPGPKKAIGRPKGRRESKEVKDYTSFVGKPGFPEPRPKNLPRAKFTDDDDKVLIALKEREKPDLSWAQIRDFFPGRSGQTLQVRYCTKLNTRGGTMEEMKERMGEIFKKHENKMWVAIKNELKGRVSADTVKRLAFELGLELTPPEPEGNDDQEDGDDGDERGREEGGNEAGGGGERAERT